MSNYDLFGNDYFERRIGNDPLRQQSFLIEKQYIKHKLGPEIFGIGRLLDIGCGTGEFIDALGWSKERAYGIEVSDHARGIATQKGIHFDRGLENSKEFFDLIVYRGTIQYLPNPFDSIYGAHASLRTNGHILFLATPNTNSFYYRHFETLPFLEERLNFWIPSDISLCMVLQNAGFEVREVKYPYFGTPYSRPINDHFKCLRKLLMNTADEFPFWGSSMWVLAKKR